MGKNVVPFQYPLVMLKVGGQESLEDIIRRPYFARFPCKDISKTRWHSYTAIAFFVWIE